MDTTAPALERTVKAKTDGEGHAILVLNGERIGHTQRFQQYYNLVRPCTVTYWRLFLDGHEDRTRYSTRRDVVAAAQAVIDARPEPDERDMTQTLTDAIVAAVVSTFGESTGCDLDVSDMPTVWRALDNAKARLSDVAFFAGA